MSMNENPKQARAGINRYLEIYNTFRPHHGLGGLTPHEVYFGKAVYSEAAANLFD